MTENEIGKVVVGLYSSREVTKNAKGKKTIIFCFIFLNFVFLVLVLGAFCPGNLCVSV